MTDDENNKNQGLEKFGYDPLDDIKPIDTSDYDRRKDDTLRDPAELGADGGKKRRVDKAAPQSALEKKESASQDGEWQDNHKDLVRKGDYFSLTTRDPTMRSIIVGAGWEQRSMEKEPIDIDLSCFLLDKNDSTRIDGDFVFYNNPIGCEGAVKLLEDSRGGGGDGDDERIFLDLNGVPFEIIRIMFTITIYDPTITGLNFSDIRDLYLRVFNYESEQELARFIVPLDELAAYNGIYCAAMVREGPQWYLQPLAEPVKEGLSPMARKYGLLIAEEAG